MVYRYGLLFEGIDTLDVLMLSTDFPIIVEFHLLA
jgi:hypothetical protein